jgi:FkbM family methyltransferase
LGELEKDKMKKFYSQAGQDEWIVDFFQSKKNGFFLDVGANDGININNTYFLEKELGWNGICIEADPNIFKNLIVNRKCSCINVAISNDSKRIHFLPDGLSGREFDSPTSIKIHTKTLKEVLDGNNSPKIIDYLSLDIEGMELKALEGFPFDEYKIITLTVEHNLYLGKKEYKEKIKKFLEIRGYLLYKENVESEGLPFEDWYIIKK